MTNSEIIQKTVEYVRTTLAGSEGGHDWRHIERVWKLSKQIAQEERGNLLIVELGALLHDIADAKFYGGDETVGPKKARGFLESIRVEPSVVEGVVKIVENISFRSRSKSESYSSPELRIVQDADRLDALGAIGIARAMSYGGYKNREIYNPTISPNLKMTKEEYKKSTSPTVNHFYEKLFLLRDLMNTKTGRKLAEARHKFMEHYLKQFYEEWEGKK